MGGAQDIAIIGVGSLLADQLLEVIEERELPVGAVHGLVVAGAETGEVANFRGRPLRLAAFEGFDFTRVSLVFLLESVDVAPLLAAGCRVVDLTRDAGARPGALLAVAELQAETVQAAAPATVVASPMAGALAAALVLSPVLAAGGGLQHLNLVLLEPASAAGRGGVEELARQSARLLNGLGPEPRLFPGQLAFNLLPQVGELDADGHGSAELAVARDLAALLGLASLPGSVSVVQAPVFHGSSLALHVETREPLGAVAARKLLRRQPGVKLVDQPERGIWPAAVSDRFDRDRVCVGRVRDGGHGSHQLDFWVVADNLRKGAAVNSVQLAEILMKSTI